ncbi:FecCD family ABC transporter permease [Microbacterium sp. 1P06AB]|uniref:FecCD family ABC transporter permease n=1 Tax=Microbacterium sp. 1P06AB TaxID=3132289 RepID=UPI0039A5A2BA
MTAHASPSSGVAVVRRPNRVRLAWLLALTAVTVVLVAASITIGSRAVSWDEIVAAFTGSQDTLAVAAVGQRFPRTVLGLVVGGALGVAGAVMQGVTRNPLADPGILGVNMGASLAIVAGIAWFGLSSATGYIWVAIAGSAVAAVFVYAVGSMGRGGATPLKLALAGAATSAALVSFVTAISLPRGDISGNVRSWLIGGVGGATWNAVSLVAPFLLAGFVVSLLTASSLNSLALGDELAAGLGERVAVARGVAALGAVLLCGAATAVAGPIAFVGLVVPHACRLLIGVDHRWLLPFSGVAGAGLLLGADIIGRVIARPAEIDAGIVTAVIGAPVFIAIVRRQKVKSL